MVPHEGLRDTLRGAAWDLDHGGLDWETPATVLFFTTLATLALTI